MTTPRHAVIIGGGVIGLSCAYYLSRTGWRATILESGQVGGGCSHGNCGFISPSHALPLAAPGAIKKTLKAMISPNSPFSIKPRFDPQLWMWLLRFARRCNQRDMLSAGRALSAMLAWSRSLYPQLIEEESLACEFQEQGLLFAFRDAGAFEHYADTNELQKREFNVEARRLDAEEVQAFEPALLPEISGGWYFSGDAHLRPDRLMASWRSAVEKMGVQIKEQTQVTGIVQKQGSAVACQTTAGEIEGDAIILAAGALSPKLAKLAGNWLPIQPGKGNSLTMPRPAICPRVPMIFPQDKVAVTPFASGYRIGSTMEFAGYDSTLNPRRLKLLTEGAKRYLREPMGEPIEEKWCGWRPMSCDDIPIIGPADKVKNLFFATGHGMLGLSMATGTGKLIADLVTQAEPGIDPRPYSPSRFA